MGDITTMPDALPTGVVTFLFTDMEGSTRLAQQLGEGYPELADLHYTLLRRCITAHGGALVADTGDGILAAFREPRAALDAAADAQRGLREQRWPGGVDVRVRMGLHTGPASTTGSGYRSVTVHLAARVMEAAYGGQVLVSGATIRVAGSSGAGLIRLGRFLLRDFDEAVELWQLETGSADVFPGIRATPAGSRGVPDDPPDLVGRDADVDRTMAALTPGAIVTLTGPGGVGKTRLAVRVARLAIDSWAEMASWVDLAAIRNPGDIVVSVARAAGASQTAGRDLMGAVVDVLRRRRHLLVLDNAEHVSAACADLVAHLHEHVPTLRVLTTSRFPLGVPHEHVVRLQPLACPGADDDPVAAMRRPAMQLLVARAAEHGVEFGADAASIAELADLTRSLAGLPLALELAAARTTVLAPGEIVARLITESDPGDADADDRRQATVAGTVAWSYALCGDAERQMLCRLSVFVAGARLSAIAAVCGNDDGDVPADADPEPALIDAVAGLLAKSLLDGTTSGGVRRFRLQALVRSFAADQQPADEASRIRARHRRWAVAWATRQPDEPQGAYLRRLDDEHDELLEALRLAEQDEPHVAGELALLLAPYWEHRALFAVGDERLHRLAARADLPELMSMRLQMQSARFDVWLGRALPARDRLRGMPDRFLAVGDAANALCAQADLTHVEFQLGELTTWSAPLRALVDDPEIRPAARAVALSRLSNHARVRGEIDAGIEMTRQARDLYRQAGDDTSAALMTLTLGHFAYYQQRESDSLRYYQQALEELIASGRPRAHTAMAQGSVGMAMYWLKDYRGARAMLLEALSELEEVGAATAETAYRLAAIDLECGELNEAERLLIAAVDDVRRTEKFHDLVEALAALAQLHIMRMDFATAELHAREAADLLDRVPSEAQKASTVYTMLVYAMRGLNRADAEIAAVIVAGLRTAPLTSGALLHNGAVLMARVGRLHEAARVMGVLDSAGLVGWEHEWVGWDEYEVRQRMGDAAFEAAASAGRGGSEQEAVDLVLARLTELEPVT